MIIKKILEQKPEGLLVRIKIVPNASKNEILFTEDEVKVRVTAQPIENKANKALVEILAKKLKVPKTSIKLVKGETCKEKTILINNITEAVFLEILSK